MKYFQEIKDTTSRQIQPPRRTCSFRDDMTDTASTHARPNRNDFLVPGGCWLAFSPPNLRFTI
jgi:hypothetical protein